MPRTKSPQSSTEAKPLKGGSNAASLEPACTEPQGEAPLGIDSAAVDKGIEIKVTAVQRAAKSTPVKETPDKLFIQHGRRRLAASERLAYGAACKKAASRRQKSFTGRR